MTTEFIISEEFATKVCAILVNHGENRIANKLCSRPAPAAPSEERIGSIRTNIYQEDAYLIERVNAGMGEWEYVIQCCGEYYATAPSEEIARDIVERAQWSRPAPEQPDCENCRKVFHLTQNLKTALEMAKQPPAPTDAVLDELIEFARWVQQKQPEALAIMEKQGIVIDNLDDKIQKLAFTFYSEIAEMSHKAEVLLEEHKSALRARENKGGERE